MLEPEPMSADQRCERCNRADCRRDDSWVAMTTGDPARSAANGDARRDCEAHAVDWRALALAMSAAWIEALTLAGVDGILRFDALIAELRTARETIEDWRNATASETPHDARERRKDMESAIGQERESLDPAELAAWRRAWED